MIKRNKPIHVEAAELDIPKLQLCNFHYEKIKSVYGRKLRVLHKDTDFLFYKIGANDMYEDLEEL